MLDRINTKKINISDVLGEDDLGAESQYKSSQRSSKRKRRVVNQEPVNDGGELAESSYEESMK